MHLAQNTCASFVKYSVLHTCASMRYDKGTTKQEHTTRKEQTNMKAYKIFVDGLYIGTEDFTPAEVESIQRDEEITLVRA